MKVLFTICSVNYMAQARVLNDSVKMFLPDYKFIIGLVDKLPLNIKKDFLPDCEILELGSIEVPELDSMLKLYNIVELNTAVKPYYFKAIFNKYAEASLVFYIDPDIILFNSFHDLENQFVGNTNIVLTPHYSFPIFEEISIQEKFRIMYGFFNGGFVALKKSKESDLFIDWWSLKLKQQCIEDVESKLYVDQLWLNFTPVNFDGVCVFRNVGYNVAYWNLHERTISIVNEKFIVNNIEPLVFFHYSSFKISISDPSGYEYQNRRLDIVPFLDLYARKLVENHHHYFNQYLCHYISLTKKVKWKDRFPGRLIYRVARKISSL